VVAGRRWDLSAVKVIAGDGADRVKEGLGYFAPAVYQLCRFHLARKIRECLRGRALERVFAARKDPARLLEEARNAVAAALDPEAKRGAEELLSYLLANREGLEDYRRRVNVEGVELRGLGAIESNVDKIVSGRMKKRGMSWTVEGARNMLAVLTLKANGSLDAAAQVVWGPDYPEGSPTPRLPIDVSVSQAQNQCPKSATHRVGTRSATPAETVSRRRPHAGDESGFAKTK